MRETNGVWVESKVRTVDEHRGLATEKKTYHIVFVLVQSECAKHRIPKHAAKPNTREEYDVGHLT